MATRKCKGRGIVKTGARKGLCKKVKKKAKGLKTASGNCRFGKAKVGKRKGQCLKSKRAKK